MQPYRPPYPNAPPLPDAPSLFPPPPRDAIDWSSSFHGLSTLPFPPEVAKILMAPLPYDDVEVKPDGIIYLPEIKYRRILNQAFGPGGWGMAPRGDLAVGERIVTREYALLVHGRYVTFSLSLSYPPSQPALLQDLLPERRGGGNVTVEGLALK